MAQPKLSPLELKIMEAFWTEGALSVREVQERFPETERPAYTTVQTMVYRLEAKKAVRRAKKIGNAHVFEAAVSRQAASGRLIDEALALFGGKMQPLMAQLVDDGKLTLADIEEAERRIKALAAERKARGQKG